MPLVSVTRARIRRVWSVPPFALAAFASLQQARAADGFLGGSVCPDRRLAFWTLTVWRSEDAMRAYILSGPHRGAMSKFAVWCDEASVVHWEQAGEAAPPWIEAAERSGARRTPIARCRTALAHRPARVAEPPPSSCSACRDWASPGVRRARR